MLYHYPKLSERDYGLFRSPGPGLGNLMLPISRAAIGQVAHGGVMIHPTMAQFKLGPFIRFERDKRTYVDIFRGRTGSEWKDIRAFRSLPRVAEDAPVPESGTIVYEGLRDFFHPLKGQEATVRDWVFGNLRAPAPQIEAYDIAIHVRLGDFAANTSGTGGGNVRQSWDWYHAALARAREIAGTSTPRIRIFTDGDFEEVRNGLDLADADIDQHPKAIDAMIAMSKARVLVCSRSTFSMWGSYLGDGQALWDAAFDLDAYFPMRDGRDHLV